jgi:ribulose 1,5-bisphosphate carboxylase large subunit-like protein
VNKNESHPSKGWDDINVGDLVYYGTKVNRRKRGADCQIGVVMYIHGTAAVVYSYSPSFGIEKLVRTKYLERVI